MADLRKEELFPADAFGLFYLQVTRIPGGWHRHAEYEIFYHISGPIVFEVASPDCGETGYLRNVG